MITRTAFSFQRIPLPTSILASLCGLLLASSLYAAETAPPDDADINSAVVNHLLFDSSVPSNEIDVTTVDGIVTLSGKAPNLLAKERSTMIAEALKGVRSVVNDITVKPVDRTDEEIRNDVLSALKSDSATDQYEVKVAVKDGVVTLSGAVDSWQEKQLSATVAEGVKGVREIHNELEFTNKTERSDSEIAADVTEVLDRDVWVDAILVHVDVKDGTVALTGSVGSVAEKNRVRVDAWTAGVRKVDDSELRVEPWAEVATADRRKEFVPKSNEEIQQAVKDALLMDPRVLSFNPDVSVENGTVTLSGVVDNLKAKNAAVQDAKNTAGVWRVKNHLKVRPAAPHTNENLADNVKAALIRDPYVDRYQIGVSAINGTVYLSGTVDTSFEKSQAEEVVSKVKGVVNVNNGLVVSYPSYTHYTWPYSWYYNAPYYYNRMPGWWTWPHATDAEIKEDIESEFFWSPFVDDDKIKVSVNNGVATLTGTVDSWSDYGSATDNAYQGGAHTVVNELEVKP